jgi:hypothetical protein
MDPKLELLHSVPFFSCCIVLENKLDSHTEAEISRIKF